MRKLFIFSFMLLSIIITGCSDNKPMAPGDQYGYLAKSSVIIWDEDSIEKVLYAAKKKDIQQLPNLFNSHDSKKTSLKLVFQNKGNNTKTININGEANNDAEFNRKILTLSKNKDLLSNRRDYIFKRILSSSNRPSNAINAINDKNNKNYIKSEIKTNYLKKSIKQKQLKDEFLLFAKARPYKYLMTSVEN